MGGTIRDVRRQLEEFVQYLARNGGFWEIEPDFFDVELRSVKVPVVPEYRVHGRTFPSKKPILLKLPCAMGRRGAGMLSAILPTVDVMFDFNEPGDFPGLVQHYVNNALSGLAPRDITPFLPPEKSWIEELKVRLQMPDDDQDAGDTPATPLTSVADHLGDRGFRRITKTWERKAEVSDLGARLQDNSASICLIGPGGCGKTSILVEAARQMERSLKEKGRRGSRAPKLFWMSSAGRLVAGMRYLGQWEERLEQVIDELIQLEGILCIENLLELVRLGGSGPQTSLGAFLLPYLEHGELRIVTEATPEEAEACERLLPPLVDQLQILKLEPFDDPRARRVLHNAAAHIGQSAGVSFSPDAVESTFHLFRHFQPYAGFPARPIHFLSETSDTRTRTIATRSASTSSKPATPVITGSDVRKHFSKSSGLPERLIDDTRPFEITEATDFLASRVLGQCSAVDSIARGLARF